jgi:putative endonuclease
MSGRGLIAVYVLCNAPRGTLYLGVTNNLHRRLDEHARASDNSFVGQYRCTRLVWWEKHARMDEAIRREKQIKNWKRSWKFELVETINPDWDDLSTGLPYID